MLQLKTGTARLSGRVVSAETGKPLRRAQVVLSAPDTHESRAVSTDGEGRWEVKDLPAGRYSIAVSKAGYVSVTYGQKHSFEPGTPVEALDDRLVDKLDVSLPKASVIAGRIVDEFGEPLANVRVSAMRHRYIDGQRRLVPVNATSANDQTDDLGQYRLYGLPPGDYYVTASLTTPIFDRSDDRTSFAPTFFPGTPALAEAQRVTLTEGQEAQNVTFPLSATPTASISGVVLHADGRPFANSAVMLFGSSSIRGPAALTGMSVVRPDGTFTLTNVPPGDYRLQTILMEDLDGIARTGSNANMSYAEVALVPIAVSGRDIAGLTVVTGPSATASGRIVFEPALPAGTRAGAVTLGAMPIASTGYLSGGGSIKIHDDWTFDAAGLSGPRVFRAFAAPPGWILKSVTLNGHEVTDTGIDFAPGENRTGIDIVLSNRTASLSGSVKTAKGEPTTDYAVIAFVSDNTKWGPFTRFVRAARPDGSGHFKIPAIVPEDYLVVAVEYLAPGDEGDPEVLERLKAQATAVSVKDGENKTITLTIVK